MRRYDPEREEARNTRSRYAAALGMGYSSDEAAAYANNPDASKLDDRRPPPEAAPASTEAPPAAAGSSPSASDTPDEPTIPENWEQLPWPARLKLAASVSPTPVSNSEDVVTAIENELARRAGA
jgi:hypothetical protein